MTAKAERIAQTQALKSHRSASRWHAAHAETESLWQDAFRRLIRNRAAVMGGSIILLLILTAIFARNIAVRPFDKQVLTDQNKVPQWVFSVFPTMKPYARIDANIRSGADYVGRDLFSRIVYGARISLTVAFIGPLISLIIGVIYGSISGYFGGRADNIMMRVVDVLYAFPGLLFIILLMAFFRSTFPGHSSQGPSLYDRASLIPSLGGMLFIYIGIGLTAWETMARLTRGQVLSVREKEFIEAARTIGASEPAHHVPAHPAQHHRAADRGRNAGHPGIYLRPKPFSRSSGWE